MDTATDTKAAAGTASGNARHPSMTTDAQSQAVTDGFHLIIDALKLNGIDTIFGLPGIPITDFTRKAQAEGMRVISFRHEQNAGNAAAIAGFMAHKPGICLTVSAPGFLNGLTALANASTNCFPMILISGSSEREILDRPAKLFAQTMDAEAGKKSLIKVVDPAPKQIPGADAVKRAVDLLKSARRPLILLGKGAAYAQADADIRALIERTGIPYLPMSMAKGLLPATHEQSAAATRSHA